MLENGIPCGCKCNVSMTQWMKRSTQPPFSLCEKMHCIPVMPHLFTLLSPLLSEQPWDSKGTQHCYSFSPQLIRIVNIIIIIYLEWSDTRLYIKPKNGFRFHNVQLCSAWTPCIIVHFRSRIKATGHDRKKSFRTCTVIESGVLLMW